MLIATVLYCLQAILSVILEEVWRPTQTELDSSSRDHHDPLGIAFWVSQWQPLGPPAFGLQDLIWSIPGSPAPGISTVGACWRFLCSPNDLPKVWYMTGIRRLLYGGEDGWIDGSVGLIHALCLTFYRSLKLSELQFSLQQDRDKNTHFKGWLLGLNKMICVKHFV